MVSAPVTAVERVGVGASLEPISTAAARDHVAGGAAGHDVVAVTTVDACRRRRRP